MSKIKALLDEVESYCVENGYDFDLDPVHGVSVRIGGMITPIADVIHIAKDAKNAQNADGPSETSDQRQF